MSRAQDENPVVLDGERVELASPVAMPRASAFLWNRRMMLQSTCRGFAVAQHMQPEPTRYAHAPVLEARTFMQPEPPRYAHHPGRFVYVRDEADGSLFSVPYEPVRRLPGAFRFSAGPADLRWEVEANGLRVSLGVSLPVDDAVELWTLELRNEAPGKRRLGVYPFFPIGYMSWMNQSARYRPELGGLVASSVTPYQKVEDYARVRSLRDLTFLLHDAVPLAWEASLEAFEGEGGLHDPDALRKQSLARGEAHYELPAAVLQYRVELAPGAQRSWRFLFGPARDDAEIAGLRARYLGRGRFEAAAVAYRGFLEAGGDGLRIETPDPAFDHFVNHWLGRQLQYHGELQRLTTDPQTRNYLQDAMGMAFLQPQRCRQALLLALSQQQDSGALPDGVLLHPGAELKYINQVPHSDHGAWLPLAVEAYLDETADFALLDLPVEARDGGPALTVRERVALAMHRLAANRDPRGLSYIGQGDWCDPMNMVGHRGRGVSGWLSLATVHGLRTWAAIVERDAGKEAAGWRRIADEMACAVQQHLWDGNWFARGITDDGVPFGVAADDEGRIYLNPQSWALLAGVATPRQTARLLRAVEQWLESPQGVALLAPPYTRMREDIGRLTQKFPGSAENGSVYNHAAAFYVRALFGAGEVERAWRLLRRMLPGPAAEDYVQRGQLPVFLPNYYRGDGRRRPRTAGRSSQLVNTGTVAWFYRIVIEDLFGLRGTPDGLRFEPRLPAGWPGARIERRFRGARLEVTCRRVGGAGATRVRVNGRALEGPLLAGIEPGARYQVEIELPGGDA